MILVHRIDIQLENQSQSSVKKNIENFNLQKGNGHDFSRLLKFCLALFLVMIQHVSESKVDHNSSVFSTFKWLTVFGDHNAIFVSLYVAMSL